jgi:hypothetical protein
MWQIPRTMTECRQTLHLQAERGMPGQNQEQKQAARAAGPGPKTDRTEKKPEVIKEK